MKEQLDIFIKHNLQMFKPEQKRSRIMYSIANPMPVDDFIETKMEDNKFQTMLFNYIDSKHMKDSDVYNKVNMDRRLFSKLRNEDYHPSKETIILLGLALELDERELEKLLLSASYALPRNNYFDLIIRFCFQNKIYNVFEVNELLVSYNCKSI